LPFGIYYSQGEWFDADFVQDHKNGFNTSTFYTKKVVPQRMDLVHRYPKAMLWHTDGGWMAPDRYWNNLDWLTYVYDKSPLAAHVVSCNSMGVGCCHTAGSGAAAKKCWEYGDAPSGGDRTTAGMVTAHFYTNQMTIQRGSWSWDRSEDAIADFFSADELLWTLISTTAWNGTLVVNIGPTADGLIPPIFEDRLASMGKWLALNGEAIYSTRPWPAALPSGFEGGSAPTFAGRTNATYYTMAANGTVVYGVLMTYPTPDASGSCTVTLTMVPTTSSTEVSLLGMPAGATLRWQATGTVGIAVTVPCQVPTEAASAWVLKFTGLRM